MLYNGSRRARALRTIRRHGYVPTGKKLSDRVYELAGVDGLEGKFGIVIFADYEDVKDAEKLHAFLNESVKAYDQNTMSACFAVDYYFGAVAIDLRWRKLMSEDIPTGLF